MAVTNEQAGALLAEVDDILRTGGDRDQTTDRVMRRIADRLPHYNWVGVYVVDGGMLHLGPYVGEPTEHTLIPIGRGVCGTAVATGKNQVVDDVRALDNYLACSLETRSEIVVLVRDPADGQIVAQIDADGHTVGAFDASDEALLEQIAARLAPLWSGRK
jgi:GAF domain-containing protein